MNILWQTVVSISPHKILSFLILIVLGRLMFYDCQSSKNNEDLMDELVRTDRDLDNILNQYENRSKRDNSAVAREYVIVSTGRGKIRGYRLKPHQFTIYHQQAGAQQPLAVDCFLGIPFAKPPVGNYRFRSPEPLDPLPVGFDSGEIFNATIQPNSCPQPLDTTFGEDFAGTGQWNAPTNLSEDCLYLNIWTPYPRSNNPRLPVFVWIYGGSYSSGSISLKLYDGKMLASRFNVIVVSINYRVGALGFLFTNDPVQNPGNAGLFDQLMAFKWIKQHIHHFGGDPDSITLVGESAGATSIAYHLLSPLSAPYFNRAILQSAAANNPWGHVSGPEALRRAHKLGSLLGCLPSNQSSTSVVDVNDINTIDNPTPTGNNTSERQINDAYYASHFITEENPLLADEALKLQSYDMTELAYTRSILKCLRNKDFHEILANEYYVTKDAMDFPFAPVSDGELVKAKPDYLLDLGLFKKANILIGSNRNEGTAFLVYYLDKIFAPLRENISITDEELKWAIDRIYFRYNKLTRNAVSFHYTKWTDILAGEKSMEDIRLAQVDEMAGDYWFTCKAKEFADYYASSGAKVYVYRFMHRSTTNAWPKWMGTMHGDEIHYMMGDPLKIGSVYTNEEKDLSLNMMRFWTNFAKHGDPNKNADYDWTGIRWPEYTNKKQECLELNVGMNKYDFNITRGPKLRNCAFQKFIVNLNRDTEKLKWSSSQCAISDKQKHKSLQISAAFSLRSYNHYQTKYLGNTIVNQKYLFILYIIAIYVSMIHKYSHNNPNLYYYIM